MIEAKIQASILLKSLRGSDAEKTAKRFKRLAEFANLSIAEILQKEIKHKYALHLLQLKMDLTLGLISKCRLIL